MSLRALCVMSRAVFSRMTCANAYCFDGNTVCFNAYHVSTNQETDYESSIVITGP
ncbi:hypothetical protein DFO54_10497 [Erwinia sp. AG740]|nr:hypothetical protein DFO54_10497 [Erwinia sp. AG740]